MGTPTTDVISFRRAAQLPQRLCKKSVVSV
jgi:hypothetical protein